MSCSELCLCLFLFVLVCCDGRERHHGQKSWDEITAPKVRVKRLKQQAEKMQKSGGITERQCSSSTMRGLRVDSQGCQCGIRDSQESQDWTVSLQLRHVCSTTCSIPHSLTNFSCTRYTRYQQICQLNSSMRTDNQQFIGWVPIQYFQARRTAPCYRSQFRDKLLAHSSVRSTQRRFTTETLRATHIETRFHNQHSHTTATHRKGRRQTQYAEPDTKMGPHMLGLL